MGLIGAIVKAISEGVAAHTGNPDHEQIQRLQNQMYQIETKKTISNYMKNHTFKVKGVTNKDKIQKVAYNYENIFAKNLQYIKEYLSIPGFENLSDQEVNNKINNLSKQDMEKITKMTPNEVINKLKQVIDKPENLEKHKTLLIAFKTLQTSGMVLDNLKNNPIVKENQELLKQIEQISKYSDAGIVYNNVKAPNKETQKNDAHYELSL